MIEQRDRIRQRVVRQRLLRMLANGIDGEIVDVLDELGNNDRHDLLAQRCIVEADNGAFGDILVFQQDTFDVKRRDLIASTFNDVHGLPAAYGEDVFHWIVPTNITGFEKTAVTGECRTGLFSFTPIFLEDSWTLNVQFSFNRSFHI